MTNNIFSGGLRGRGEDTAPSVGKGLRRQQARSPWYSSRFDIDVSEGATTKSEREEILLLDGDAIAPVSATSSQTISPIPNATALSTNVIVDGDFSNHYNDAWKSYPGGPSGHTFTLTFWTFFGIALIIFTGTTRNIKFGTLYAFALTLAAIYPLLMIDPYSGHLLVSCDDVWEKNLGLGVILGVFLAWTIFCTQLLVSASKLYRDRQEYKDSSVSLRGIVVQKSSSIVWNHESEEKLLSNLHIGYNFSSVKRSSFTEKTYQKLQDDYDDEEEEVDQKYCGDDTIIAPFGVDVQTYDQSQIGDHVELLYVPGNPFSVKVKSLYEVPDNWCTYAVQALLVYPIFAYPLFVGLGFYLPQRILNWGVCNESVLVCASTMVVTATLLLCICRYFCFQPPPTISEAQQIIQNERERVVDQESDEELKSLFDISLASLKDKVGGMSDDSRKECGMTYSELDFHIYSTIFQTQVSAGHDIPSWTIVRDAELDEPLDAEAVVTAIDYSFKEGETIRLNIKNMSGQTGEATSERNERKKSSKTKSGQQVPLSPIKPPSKDTERKVHDSVSEKTISSLKTEKKSNVNFSQFHKLFAFDEWR